jgi:hypothetical protein
MKDKSCETLAAAVTGTPIISGLMSCELFRRLNS